MSAQLPPSPSAFNNMRAWASAFYEFYLAQTRVNQDNDPLPVLLPHRADGIIERASVGGILLFQPETQEAVVSASSAWAPLSSLPSYTATQIADASHEVNTLNKRAGRMVIDTTNNTIVVATGSGATDDWSRLTVAATVTPS